MLNFSHVNFLKLPKFQFTSYGKQQYRMLTYITIMQFKGWLHCV